MSLIRMSAAKLAANRANAAKSTGPKSDAGKRRSARNSLKSGIYAHSVPVHHHVPGDVHAFLAKMGPNFRAWLNDTPSLVLLRLQHLLVQDALLADPLNPALQRASEFFCHHLMRAELQHCRTFGDVQLNILADQIESVRRLILPAKPLAASATSPLPLPPEPVAFYESKPISPSIQTETALRPSHGTQRPQLLPAPPRPAELLASKPISRSFHGETASRRTQDTLDPDWWNV